MGHHPSVRHLIPRASNSSPSLLRRLRQFLPLAVSIALLALVAAPRPAPAAVLPVDDASDVLLVQPIDGLAAEALASALQGLGYEVIEVTAELGAVRVAIPEDAAPAALADAIARSGLARSVEPDGFVHTALLPGGSLVDRQLDYLEVIQVPEAWDIVTGDGSTVIAVVDSGIDYDHPEFKGRLAINTADIFADGIDNDRNGCVDDIAGCNFVSPLSADPSCNYTRPAPNWAAWDDAGHGTLVAGIAAAAGDDGTGVAGVSWDALILPVKVLDCTGVGRISTAAAGIRYAADRGADIINISLGTTRDSTILREAIEYAQARGALIVASAGNEPGVVTYPGRYPGVLAVGASGFVAPGHGPDYTRITAFSGNGPGLDLIAPGYLVTGPLPPALCSSPQWVCDDGGYTRTSGSSFAAALVTGAAALTRARYPDLSSQLLSSLILNSLQPASGGGPGLLDVAATLQHPLYRVTAPGTARGGEGVPVAPGP